MKPFLLLLSVCDVGLRTVATVATASIGSDAQDKGPPIKFMMMYPDENPVTNLPDMKFGTLAAVKAINDAGGVKTADGVVHELQVDLCNERNDANGRADCARQAVSNGDVAFLTRSLQN